MNTNSPPNNLKGSNPLLFPHSFQTKKRNGVRLTALDQSQRSPYKKSHAHGRLRTIGSSTIEDIFSITDEKMLKEERLDYAIKESVSTMFQDLLHERQTQQFEQHNANKFMSRIKTPAALGRFDEYKNSRNLLNSLIDDVQDMENRSTSSRLSSLKTVSSLTVNNPLVKELQDDFRNEKDVFDSVAIFVEVSIHSLYCAFPT
jgi:hypothetical protein